MSKVLYKIPVTEKHIGSTFLCEDEEGTQIYGTVFQYAGDKNFYCEMLEDHPCLEDIKHVYSETPPPELVKLLKRLIPNHIGIPANENYLTPQDITLLNELLN